MSHLVQYAEHYKIDDIRKAYEQMLIDTEIQFVNLMLVKFRGNITEVAKYIGVPRTVLYYRLISLDIIKKSDEYKARYRGRLTKCHLKIDWGKISANSNP